MIFANNFGSEVTNEYNRLYWQSRLHLPDLNFYDKTRLLGQYVVEGDTETFETLISLFLHVLILVFNKIDDPNMIFEDRDKLHSHLGPYLLRNNPLPSLNNYYCISLY